MNAQSFELTPFVATESGNTIVVLGSSVDLSSMSFTWDYPFMFMMNPSINVYAVYFQNQGDYEISVSEVKENTETIDPEYIPPFFKANVIDAFVDDETGTSSIQTDLNYDYFNNIIADPKGLAMNADAFLLRLNGAEVYPCVAITKDMTSSRGWHIILEFLKAYCGRQELYKQRYYVVLQKSESEEGVYYSELLKTPVEQVTFE